MSERKKHLIEFVEEKVVAISRKETILDASLAAGIPHFHVCGGNSKCSTCRVLVLEGVDHLMPDWATGETGMVVSIWHIIIWKPD